MSPAGPAPTTTASNTSRREAAAAISALCRGLRRESPGEVLAVGRRAIDVGRDAAAEGGPPLLRDEPDRNQDAEAVDDRVLREAHLLHDFVHARIGVVLQEVQDLDLLRVQHLGRLSLLRPRLELQPLVEALALFRGRHDDLEQGFFLDLEEVLRDRRGRDPHLGRQLRDFRVAVAIHLVLDDDRKDLALALREEARPVGRVHPRGPTPGPVLSVLWEPVEGLCLTKSRYESEVQRLRQTPPSIPLQAYNRKFDIPNFR